MLIVSVPSPRVRGERLSFGSSVLWLPWAFVPDDCVEDGEELSGDCDERDLLWLAACDEPVAACFQRWIEARRDHGADEENGSHAAAAAADEASAFPLTGLARPWRKAGERGDGAAIERAEFGQPGDQRACDCVPDARHRDEKILLLAPGRRAAQGVVDLALDVGQFFPARFAQSRDPLLRRFVEAAQ